MLHVVNSNNNLFSGHSMKDLLLVSLVVSCASFQMEHDLINIVNGVKNFFYSDCIFFLHDKGRGKYSLRNRPW